MQQLKHLNSRRRQGSQSEKTEQQDGQSHKVRRSSVENLGRTVAEEQTHRTDSLTTTGTLECGDIKFMFPASLRERASSNLFPLFFPGTCSRTYSSEVLFCY